MIPADRPAGPSVARGRDGTGPTILFTSGVLGVAPAARCIPFRALILRALPRPLAARLPHPIGA